MDEQRPANDTAVVAVARSASEAEFLKVTLAAHGLAAVTEPSEPAYPSVDFVQGVRVSVPIEQEAAARELLAALEETE